MILLCEVISGDLVLQYSGWFGLWGHISVDLLQELIGCRRAYVCVCAESVSCGLWWGRWRAARDGSVAATCVFVCFPLPPPFNTHTYKHTHTHSSLAFLGESEGEESCFHGATTGCRRMLPNTVTRFYNVVPTRVKPAHVAKFCSEKTSFLFLHAARPPKYSCTSPQALYLYVLRLENQNWHGKTLHFAHWR